MGRAEAFAWAMVAAIIIASALMACSRNAEGVTPQPGNAVSPAVDYFEYKGMPCLWVFSEGAPHRGGATCDWSKYTGE